MAGGQRSFTTKGLKKGLQKVIYACVWRDPPAPPQLLLHTPTHADLAVNEPVRGAAALITRPQELKLSGNLSVKVIPCFEPRDVVSPRTCRISLSFGRRAGSLQS